MSKYYGVWNGRKPGIYTTWEECKVQINQFPNARFKKLNSTTYEDAVIEFNQGSPVDFKGSKSFINSKKEKPIEKILTVDGAANGICCEFQAVWTTGENVFSSQQFAGGTNNIAEFLGLVYAIRYLSKNNLPLIVYTDSVTAMAWVRNKKANTTAQSTGKLTEELKKLIANAESYLNSNVDLLEKMNILKWETKQWGEIPADYGRK